MKKLIKQLISFGIVGVICFVIDYGLMVLLTEAFGVRYIISSGISFTVSVIVNYILSVKFVFDVNKKNNQTENFFMFVVLSVIGLGLNQLIMWFGVEKLVISYLIVKIGATAIVMVYNFITRKLFLEKDRTAQRKELSQKDRVLRSVLLAFTGTCGICYSFRYYDILNVRLVTVSSLAVFIFAALIWLIGKSLVINDKIICRKGFWAGAVFALLLVIGNNYYINDNGGFMQYQTYLIAAALIPVTVSVVKLILKYVPGYDFKVKSDKTDAFFFEDFADSGKWFFITWIIIFACWSVALAAAWPGIYSYDAIYQTKQVITDGIISSHHPVLHTLYLSYSLILGEKLFGSYEAGMAIYSISQMLIMSAIFTYTLRFMARYKTPVVLIILSFIFLTFAPINIFFSFSSTKDVLFSGFFLLAILLSIEAAKDRYVFFNSKKKMFALAATLFLMCAFRNNAFYAFILYLPFCAYAFRKDWRKMSTLNLAAILCYIALTGPIYNMLGIKPGDEREALSVPVQQMSRALRDNREELSDDEISFIYAVIPNADGYVSHNADNTKNSFDTDLFFKDAVHSIKMYTEIGMKCKLTYIDAFLSNNFGYWYTDMIYSDSASFQNYLEYDNTDSSIFPEYMGYTFITRQSKLPHLDRINSLMSYGTSWEFVPVISMLFSPGMMFWLLVITMMLLSVKKAKNLKFILMMPFMYWFTMLAGPVVMVRYVYILLLMMPVYCTLIFGKRDPEKEFLNGTIPTDN